MIPVCRLRLEPIPKLEVITRVLADLVEPAGGATQNAAVNSDASVGNVVASPTNYVKIYGSAAVTVSDSAGHSTSTSDPSKVGVTLPGVSFNLLGDNSVLVVLPNDQEYKITFSSVGSPVFIEFSRGTDGSATQAARFQDVTIPAGSTALLKVTPTAGLEDVRYDTKGDGLFTQLIFPTASVTGAAAQDVDQPTLSIASAPQGTAATITITANDAGSGVKRVMYSTNGTQFQQYGGPLTVDTSKVAVVTAFAEDVAGNRSPSYSQYVSLNQNLIDSPGFYVTQHYRDFLSREPDNAGLAFWTNEISSCGSNTQCQEVKRINVSAAYFLSIEFQETGYLVERMYKVAYGDAAGISNFGPAHTLPVPIMRLNDFLPDASRIGQGVIIGQPGDQALLEANKNTFALEFVQRQRFLSAFPLTMTPAQVVDKMNQNAGSVLTQGQRDALVALLAASSDANTARGQVLRSIAENAALNNTEKNRAFVLMQFYGYLRRNPNDLQDTDYSGYDFWLQKLNQFNGDFVRAEMVKAFITSGEYRQRFGQ